MHVPAGHFLLNARQVCETLGDERTVYLSLIFRDPANDAFVRVDVPFAGR